MKTTIQPYPPNLERPYERPFEHLEPLVDALIEAGNEPVDPSRFFKTRDGWHCDLKRPIDFDMLEARFDFPKSIALERDKDSIFCRNSWIEIKGGVAS